MDYFFDPDFGHDTRNRGTSRWSPWKSLAKLNGLVLKPGDRVFLRIGGVFTGMLSLRYSGTEAQRISIQPYGFGTEVYPYPVIDNPDETLERPICIEFLANYIDVIGIEMRTARYCGAIIYQTHHHNRLIECFGHGVGIGVRIKGSFNEVSTCHFYKLRMARDKGDKSDVGGVPVALEVYKEYENKGNYIHHCFAEVAISQSDFFIVDGGFVEVSGPVTDYRVECNTMNYGKGLAEIGGANPTPGTWPKAVTKNASFRNNVAVGVDRLFFFNNPLDTFGIDVQNVIVEGNTFLQDGTERSAVFWSGDWYDLSTRFTFRRNVWSGQSSFIGTDGKQTKLNTFNSQDNIYHRSLGAGLGFTPDPKRGDVVVNPGFVNAEGYDLRLPLSSPYSGRGALEPAISWQAQVVLNRNAPMHCNQIRGGTHIYDWPDQMWSIPRELREVGMTCIVRKFKRRYQLMQIGQQQVWMPIPYPDPIARAS